MTKSDLWIPSSKNDNETAKLNLFCFPYAGGTTYIYQQWSQLLPPTIAVYPIELPGRRKRFQEPPYNNLEALLAELAIAIRLLDKPFVFFGHSMGGLIAFELTRWLRRQYDIAPQHLIISACRATQLPRTKSPIHDLPDGEFIQEIIRLGGTPQAVLDNSEMMELILPTLRADFAKIETHVYREETPLEIPISVFGAEGDPEVDPEELAAWEQQTTKDFSLTMFEGDHFFIEGKRSLVLARIAGELERYF